MPGNLDELPVEFSDATPLLDRAKSISRSLVRTMWVFDPRCPKPLSEREKWAFVCSGGVIDELLAAASYLLAFAKDVASNYDHDENAHKYGTSCRVCEAEKVIAKSQGRTNGKED